MQIKVSSAKLIDAVEAINMVPSRGGIVPSEFVLIEKKGRVLSFSLASEIFGRTFVKSEEGDYGKGDWKFWVDRLMLVPFVLAAKSIDKPKPFTFKYYEVKKDKSLTIISGTRKAGPLVAIEGIDGYSVFDGKVEAELKLSVEHKNLLTLAARYATEDPTKLLLNCVYLRKGKSIVSSNKFTHFSADDSEVPVDLPCPLLLLTLFSSDKIKSIGVAGKLVRIDVGCGVLCQMLSELAKRDFPVKAISKQFINAKAYSFQFAINAGSLLRAMRRLNAYISGIVNRELLVNILGTKGEDTLLLVCRTQQGKFREKVKIKSALNKDVDITWPLPSMTSLVEFDTELKTIEVRFDENTPFHLSSKNGVQILMSRQAK